MQPKAYPLIYWRSTADRRMFLREKSNEAHEALKNVSLKSLSLSISVHFHFASDFYERENTYFDTAVLLTNAVLHYVFFHTHHS
jgi:hypothetical protein